MITGWISLALREKCPNMEFFLVRIFPHSDYLPVFSQNVGKYGPRKTFHLDTFHAVLGIVSTDSTKFISIRFLF